MFNFFQKQTSEPKTLGQIGEELAQLEYRNRGYKVIAANFFNKKGKRLGEVDFIATDGKKVIFTEVKTRSQEKGCHGTAQESVNVYKQAKLLRAVKIFLLKEAKYQKYQPQIDVVVIVIIDFSQFDTVKDKNQWKYLLKVPLDKVTKSVTIIPNAVEDWN